MTRILFLFFFIIATFSYGQSGVKSTYMAYVNYPDYSVKVEVNSLASTKIHAKEELEYYWYASNKIFKTKGGYDGKILSGNYTSFYLSNNLKEKGSFKGGLKNGVWISWFENGMMHEKMSWKKGLARGEYRRFNDKGELLLKANYRNGKLNGNQTTYENGKVLKKSKYKHGVEVIKKEKAVKEKKAKKSLKEKFQFLLKRKPVKEKNEKNEKGEDIPKNDKIDEKKQSKPRNKQKKQDDKDVLPKEEKGGNAPIVKKGLK